MQDPILRQRGEEFQSSAWQLLRIVPQLLGIAYSASISEHQGGNDARSPAGTNRFAGHELSRAATTAESPASAAQNAKDHLRRASPPQRRAHTRSKGLYARHVISQYVLNNILPIEERGTQRNVTSRRLAGSIKWESAAAALIALRFEAEIHRLGSRPHRYAGVVPLRVVSNPDCGLRGNRVTLGRLRLLRRFFGSAGDGIVGRHDNLDDFFTRL